MDHKEKFFAACRTGDAEEVRQMLLSGFSLQGCELICMNLAVRSKSIEVLKVLQEFACDLQTPFFAAIREKRDDEVDLFLKIGLSPNQKDENLMTPLLIACQNGNTKAAELLLENGAEVNVKSESSRYRSFTPLIFAVSRGYTRLMKILIRRGADVSGDGFDFSPLSWAALSGNLKAARILVRSGAKVQNPSGTDHPLEYAKTKEMKRYLHRVQKKEGHFDPEFGKPKDFFSMGIES